MEKIFARIARCYKRSLIVIAPELVPEATNWEKVFHPDAGDRPPVRARWGEGMQDNFPPIILGYVPDAAFGDHHGNDKKFACRWFYMEPTKKTIFQKMWAP
jgi:hypothetical protein